MVGTTFTEIMDHHIPRGEETSDRKCLSNLADELGELWGLENITVQQITNLLRFPQTVKASRLWRAYDGQNYEFTKTGWEKLNTKDSEFSFFFHSALLNLDLSFETHPYMIYYDREMPAGELYYLPPWKYARLHLEVKEKHCRDTSGNAYDPSIGLATCLPLFLQNTTITIEEPAVYDRIAAITVDHIVSGLPQGGNTYYLREQQQVLPTRVSIITNTLQDYNEALGYYHNHPKRVITAPDNMELFRRDPISSLVNHAADRGKYLINLPNL